jgi:mono/diheme cytochrome c family protein
MIVYARGGGLRFRRFKVSFCAIAVFRPHLKPFRLKGFVALATLVVGLWLIASPAARSQQLPEPDDLVARMGTPPVAIPVYDPHLTTDTGPVKVDYLGYPFSQIAEAILGKGWEGRAQELEFRALDGYVSRIPTTAFTGHTAFLVFARADGSPFSVDNLAQNEKDVPLAPYYLVWKDIEDAEILAEGVSIWPYQVTEIKLSTGSDAALLPQGLDQKFKPVAEFARTQCLTCHQINGYGGEKMPGNLAEMARQLSAEKFAAWVLIPSQVKPGTNMPALTHSLSEEERARAAADLYAYLVAIPLQE